MSRARKATANRPPLDESLVLFSFISDLLGDGSFKDFSDTADTLTRVGAGYRDAEGQSLYFSAIKARSYAFKPPLTLDDLRRYDAHILAHEEEIAHARASNGYTDFEHLKYFQYLAALYTEIYLDRYTHDKAGLLADLEAYRARRFADVGSYLPQPDPDREKNYHGYDLGRLAYWMATGAGKTLLMHINLRQFQHYHQLGLFKPDNTILITPTETLSRQHVDELRASGFNARHGLDPASKTADVLVTEISKLYVGSQPKAGSRGRGRAAVSTPTSHYSGSNLVLVDEGHKGTGGQDGDEKAWRTIREELGKGGFTFEYSATFAQVTEGNDELLGIYSHAVIYEYAYRRFYEDKHGKEPRIFNIGKQTSLYGEPLLLAGLLTFYEQYLYYQSSQELLQPYNLTTPLMIFVGAYVNASKQADRSEVLDVVRFLDRVLRDRAWAEAGVAALLTDSSSLQQVGGFSHRYSYLREVYAENATTLYRDLCQHLFHGVGELWLHPLQGPGVEGEIGLKLADSDDYCGVINVGDAAGFLKLAESDVREGRRVNVGKAEAIRGSLFDKINNPDSTINFLIGSKKFIEGWSSWRVSVMGLLNIGKTAGAQVLQLFGRGVRLKGLNLSLRRSSAFTDLTHPPHVNLLESLYIFGLKADYLDSFYTMLTKERSLLAAETLSIPLPIRVMPGVEQLGLKVPAVPPGFDFLHETIVFNPDPQYLRVEPANLSVSVKQTNKEANTDTVELRAVRFPLHALDFDALFAHAMAVKRKPGTNGKPPMLNLYISREAIRHFFRAVATVIAPPEVLVAREQSYRTALQRAAEDRLTTGITSFYYKARRRAETDAMQQQPLQLTGNPNFPYHPERSQYAYTISGPPAVVQQVNNLISGGNVAKEDFRKSLPRFYIRDADGADIHLYNPLLPREGLNIAPLPFPNEPEYNGGHVQQTELKYEPTGLVESESLFMLDLRAWWQAQQASALWSDYEVYVLRNQSNSGIGFQFTALDGFYPDFLLWLKEWGSERQVLAFVDPKGLDRSFDQSKVDMLADIKGLSTSTGLLITAYIVTPATLQALCKTNDRLTESSLAADHVLLQRPQPPTATAYEYVDVIMWQMHDLLTGSSTTPQALADCPSDSGWAANTGA